MAMWRIGMWGLALAAGWVMSAGLGWSADAPMTSTVLGKIHHSNLKQIALGELAQKYGRSHELKEFGRTIADDHTVADREVAALAKAELIDLQSHTRAQNPADTTSIPTNAADFDTVFARIVFDDCQEELTEEAAARDDTGDDRLRALIDELMPTLRSHRDMALRIVEEGGPRASL
jgi:predicted outer membrane protein